MRFVTSTLSLWLLALWCALGPCAMAQGEDPLKAAEELYGRGEFDDAARRVNELMLRESELGAKDQARLYLLKARLELAFDRSGELKLWLGKARAADPEVTPDPVKDPPQLIQQWEQLSSTERPSAPLRTAPSAERPSGICCFGIGVLPLGIGHFAADRPRDGALFLATEVLIVLGAHNLSGFDDTDEGSNDRRDAKQSRAIMGGAGFLGAYGYELVSMLPDLAVASPGGTNSLAKHLSLAPFGAAQAKNGHYVRAAVIAAVQSGTLLAAGMAPSDGQRRVAIGAFAATWIYAAFDGYKNHAEGAVQRSSALQILPMITPNQVGLALTFSH